MLPQSHTGGTTVSAADVERTSRHRHLVLTACSPGKVSCIGKAYGLVI
jgi:hypothetical protein